MLLGTRIGFAVLLAVFCGLACLLYFSRKRFGWKSARWVVVATIAACCPVVLGLLVLRIFAREAQRVRDAELDALHAYRTGAYQVVQGTVVHFDPMSFEGHKVECFSAQDKRFCYSDYLIAPGFRNAASHGGPIREGLPVRIAYTTASGRNVILRLEVGAK